MYRTGRLRSFGKWELAVVDSTSGEKVFRNTETGEVRDFAPAEVEDRLIKENRDAVYEPTNLRFMQFPEEDEEADDADCCCCRGASQDRFGTCPLCDGVGKVYPGRPQIERVNLLGAVDDSSFLLRNLLSFAECSDIIAQAESFGLRGCGYSESIRVNDRVLVMGEDLADLLFQRAKPYLLDVEHDVGKTARGVPSMLLKGVWKPHSLNPCFRVCKYRPGGFFLPHHDGGFCKSHKLQSIKTFMIYLNAKFHGGPTTFYTESQPHYKSPRAHNIEGELWPEKASCVVFNHNITHDGGIVGKGYKYILRTEVMYEHCSTSMPARRQGDDSSDSDFEHDGQGMGEEDDF